jgi:uncharacterized SAM-binding protein YcdF (DUF218 family)
MFFILSKTLAFLITPSNIVIGIGLAGLLLMLTRFRRAGWRLVIACPLLFIIIGVLPIGPAMIATLENRFPLWIDDGRPVDGIVVLGGTFDLRISAARGRLAITGAVERLTESAELARRYPAAKIVFAGGNPSLLHNFPPEAELAVQLFELLGVPSTRIILESRSRNTEENARYAMDLARPKPGERWLLVTSAVHMPRSVGIFRKVNFAVEPYPVDWNSMPGSNLSNFLSRPLTGWQLIDEAAHEWAGLLAYWITGQSSELFPGPR